MIYEEQKKLVQQQAQTKAQMARYDDELARKRMQVPFNCLYKYFFIYCIQIWDLNRQRMKINE